MKYLLLILLLLMSCGFVGSVSGNSGVIRLSCQMNGFRGFPKIVNGIVVMHLNKLITISYY